MSLKPRRTLAGDLASALRRVINMPVTVVAFHTAKDGRKDPDQPVTYGRYDPHTGEFRDCAKSGAWLG